MQNKDLPDWVLQYYLDHGQNGDDVVMVRLIPADCTISSLVAELQNIHGNTGIAGFDIAGEQCYMHYTGRPFTADEMLTVIRGDFDTI